MDVFVCCLLPSRTVIQFLSLPSSVVFFSYFWSELQVFIPSPSLRSFLHHFQITLNQMYLIKAQNKMNYCVFIFFPVLKIKVLSSIFLISGEQFLLQSVVQSTNRFSSVLIDVASLFPFDQFQHFYVIFNKYFDLLPNTVIMTRPDK